ncbi:MAG: DUF5696 domain-containing protein [Clostridiales bacterium]|nr:DUF5696 domain-containing protein [Clostridiales bacterium]
MKKIILRLLSCAIVIALLAALTIFVIIPLYTEEEEVHELNPRVMFYEGGKTPLKMENDKLLFELDPTTTQFKVTDKASGQEWLSNPTDAAKDPLAVAANKESLQSTAIVTYSTSSGTVVLSNYKYSIENGNYDIIQQEDGSIRVDYAIGKIEKVYIIPTAITKKRYDAFVSQMSSSTKKKLSSNYTLYDPAKLDSKKNKDEIIAMYPSVVEQPLYILKSDTSENNKKKIQDYFAEVNYTQEDYEIDQQLVASAKDNSGAVFNVTMIYRLEDGDLVVELPYSEMRYKANYPLSYVTPLPVFGAAGTADEGFMFVPEGGGALIHLNNGKLQQNSYYANMYGWDYAVRRKEMINETRCSFPVFGMAKNGASFLCLMEGATSFASVQADISQRYNSYNWICSKYNVLHADQYNVSAKTAQLVYMFEKEVPQETIVHRYRFLNTASYVDMANAYGDYLEARYPELTAASASEVSPVSVELVGAIDKKVVRFGVPVKVPYATTTFQQAEEIISDMVGRGVKNLSIRYAGWANGGVTQKVMTSVKVQRQLGGSKAMSQLIERAKEMNVPLYFDGVNCFAYDSGVKEGFIAFNNAARYTTREQVYLEPFDVVTYQTASWLNSYYLVKPDYAKRNTDNLIGKLSEMKAYGISFRDIGFLLSGDYNPKDTVTREEVIRMNVQSMLDAKAQGQRVMIRMGNDYAMPYADLITDMDLTGTPYNIIDEAVPFYQIALHGMKDYTGEPLNLSGDYVQEFLRCVEYGAGLNFTFMAEDGKVLQDTYHSNFFGANYASLAEAANALIVRYQKDMAGLNRQRIVYHDWLTADVSVTGYEDGTKVYVNYGSEAYAEGGVTVQGRDYTVERGQ